MRTPKAISLANHEIVTLAVYLLGGDAQRVDTEDVAVKANALARGRFTWRKYPGQINLDAVRKRLWDAAKPEKGGYLQGTEREGWVLTPAGLRFANTNRTVLQTAGLERKPQSSKERNWQRHERERMLASDAFAKFAASRQAAILAQEAESFFRVDAYITGSAREEKILRAKNSFGDDPELGPLIQLLESMIAKGGNQ
jgi:hypothetical protein